MWTSAPAPAEAWYSAASSDKGTCSGLGGGHPEVVRAFSWITGVALPPFQSVNPALVSGAIHWPCHCSAGVPSVSLQPLLLRWA